MFTESARLKSRFIRKRPANYLLPGRTGTAMMTRLSINIQRVHDEFQPIEKRDKPAALG
jgi:hypothetical protein